MSHSFSALRGFGLAGLATLTALAAAPAAGATAYTVNAKCDLPLASDRALAIAIDVPATAAPGPAVVPFTITGVSGSAVAPILEEAHVEVKLTTSVALPSGGATPSEIKWTYPVRFPLAYPLNAPAINLVGESGQATVVYTGVSMEWVSDSGTSQPIVFSCSLPVGDLNYPKIQVGDSLSPTRPGPLTFTPAGPGAIKVSWGASTDNVGVAKYAVTVNGDKWADVAPPSTSTTITGLEPGEVIDVDVSAVDVNGNISQPSSGTAVVDGIIPDPYGVPANLRSDVSPTSVTLSWDLAGGFEPPSWEVFQDGLKVKTVTAHTATISGLAPGRTYAFKVSSVSDSLVIGTAGPLNVTLPTAPGAYVWDLAGSATLKTFVKGTVPLKGGLGLNVDDAGAVTGDLAFQLASARLLALGFLPITAKLAFVPAGRTTGSYAAGVLKTKSLMRIKVQKTNLLGIIPIVLGNACQTRSLSDINLTSAAGFSLQDGGSLSGEFAMSDLNGCGGLTGLVSPLTKGSGNTITLQAKPPVPIAIPATS